MNVIFFFFYIYKIEKLYESQLSFLTANWHNDYAKTYCQLKVQLMQLKIDREHTHSLGPFCHLFTLLSYLSFS